MKGFTLIEVLIYIAISTIISVSLISFSITISEAQSKIRGAIRNESDGFYILRNIDSNLRNGQNINSDFAGIDVKDFSKTVTSNITEVSFKIGKNNFSISVYEKQ